MAQPNQIDDRDDFKFVIVLRIEGWNGRQIKIRAIGMILAVVNLWVKIAALVAGTKN